MMLLTGARFLTLAGEFVVIKPSAKQSGATPGQNPVGVSLGIPVTIHRPVIDRHLLAELCDRGWTIPQIAAEAGCADRTVSRRLAAYDLFTRWKHYRPDRYRIEMKELASVIDAGLTQREVRLRPEHHPETTPALWATHGQYPPEMMRPSGSW